MIWEYVEFPRIGFQIPVRRVAFQIFGLDIYAYAMIIAFAFILVTFLGMRESEKYGIRQNDIIDMLLFAFPAAIVGARIYYVIFSWDLYAGDFLSVFNIRQGGLAIYGGIIGAFAAVLGFSAVRKCNPLVILDFGVPYLLLAQGIGRWGNFVNQEAFGVNTSLPWGMTGPGIVRYLSERLPALNAMGIAVDPALPVHPAFLYESLWNIAVALILFGMRKRKHFHGEILFLYLIGYGVGRAVIESLRVDSLMYGSVRVSEFLSILLAALCLVLLLVFRRKYPNRLQWIAAAGAAGATDTVNTPDAAELPNTADAADAPAEPEQDTPAESADSPYTSAQAEPETPEQLAGAESEPAAPEQSDAPAQFAQTPAEPEQDTSAKSEQDAPEQPAAPESADAPTPAAPGGAS